GAVVALDGPRIGKHERVAPVAAVQHECARRVAVAECDDPRKPWTRRAERSERRCEVGTAVAEAAVISGAVAHAASVEAENRKACLGDPASELRLARKGAGADLVAAGDDQQSGVVRSVVERADERLALARECQPASFDKLRTPLGDRKSTRLNSS